jgi:hypothetical protein
MKRVLVGALLALFFAVPMSASADSPYVDKVDGTVEDLFPSTLHVNAISEADGTDARGQLWYTADNPGFPFVVDVAGEVTCLNVQGSNASIGMKIDRSKNRATWTPISTFRSRTHRPPAPIRCPSPSHTTTATSSSRTPRSQGAAGNDRTSNVWGAMITEARDLGPGPP